MEATHGEDVSFIDESKMEQWVTYIIMRHSYIWSIIYSAVLTE